MDQGKIWVAFRPLVPMQLSVALVQISLGLGREGDVRSVVEGVQKVMRHGRLGKGLRGLLRGHLVGSV